MWFVEPSLWMHSMVAEVSVGAPVSSGLKVHVFAVVPEAVMPPLRPMCSGQRISSALSSVSHVQRVPLRMATPSPPTVPRTPRG